MGQGRFWTTELICYFAAVWMTKCTGIGIRRFLVSILALELVAWSGTLLSLSLSYSGCDLFGLLLLARNSAFRSFWFLPPWCASFGLAPTRWSCNSNQHLFVHSKILGNDKLWVWERAKPKALEAGSVVGTQLPFLLWSQEQLLKLAGEGNSGDSYKTALRLEYHAVSLEDPEISILRTIPGSWTENYF